MPKQWSKCAWVTTTISESPVTARTAVGQLGALPGVTPGVDDERALTTEDQARGEVQLAVPAGQHAVADLDPPPLGRVGHRVPPGGPGGGDPGAFLTGPSRSIGRAACPV